MLDGADRSCVRGVGPAAAAGCGPGAVAAGGHVGGVAAGPLGRSLRHLIEVVTGLDERGAGFRSLRESIDTTTAGGRLVFHLFGALAQFEREIIRDRTVAELAAARARGRVGGRPFKLSVEQRRQARKMYDARELTVEQIGAVLGVSRTSIYRALGKTTSPAPPATATPAPGRQVEPVARQAEPVATTTEAVGDAPATVATGVAAPVDGAPAVVRSRGRSRWFVVEADPADPKRGPVAVVSGHTSQKAATTALGRARSRASAGDGEGEGALLQVRAAGQISSRLVWDSQAGRASCTSGRRRDRPADRSPVRPVAVGVSGLLPEPSGYAELLEQLKVRVRHSRVRAARAANSELLGLYWSVRRDTLDPQEQAGWGSRVIDRLATDLRAEFPKQRSWSRRNHQSPSALRNDKTAGPATVNTDQDHVTSG